MHGKKFSIDWDVGAIDDEFTVTVPKLSSFFHELFKILLFEGYYQF